MKFFSSSSFWFHLCCFLASGVSFAKCPLLEPASEERLDANVYLNIFEGDWSEDLLKTSILIGPKLKGFRSYLSSKLPSVNQLDLLRKQKKVHEEYFPPAQVHLKFDALISGKIGKILPQNCLNTLLMEYHLEKQKHLEAPNSEFQAWIFKKGGEFKILQLIGKETIPPNGSFITERLAEALTEGWSLEYHVHNHPFVLNNPTGDIAGTVIPSSPDLTTFKENIRSKKLKAIWITNGFDQIHIRADEILSMGPEWYK